MIKMYIQTVPSRADMVSKLEASTKKLSSIEEVEVVEDTNCISPLHNFLCICEKIKDSSESGLIMQDDCLWHKDADNALPDILEGLEEKRVISLFAPPRKGMVEAEAEGYNWGENYNHCWQQCIVITCDIARKILEFAQRSNEAKHDDVLLRDYLKSEGLPIYVTLPSIVQHNVNVSSVAGNPRKIGNIGYRVTRNWNKNINKGHFSEDNICKI